MLLFNCLYGCFDFEGENDEHYYFDERLSDDNEFREIYCYEFKSDYYEIDYLVTFY